MSDITQHQYIYILKRTDGFIMRAFFSQDLAIQSMVKEEKSRWSKSGDFIIEKVSLFS